MYLVKNNEKYTLPAYTVLNGLTVSSRNSATSKMFNHGGLTTADKKIDYREIELAILIMGKDQRDYFDKIDTLKGYLIRSGQQLFINEERYINVDSMSELSEEYLDGYYQVRANVTATLMALDPFFYDIYPQRQVIEITATGQSLNIYNPGNIDTPMTITITASSLLSNISLKSVTDNGRLMTYSDANFTSGSSLVISNVDGTVALNGSNTINNFSGTFLSLLAGNNIFTWTGGTCTIQIDFNVRWL